MDLLWSNVPYVSTKSRFTKQELLAFPLLVHSLCYDTYLGIMFLFEGGSALSQTVNLITGIDLD